MRKDKNEFLKEYLKKLQMFQWNVKNLTAADGKAHRHRTLKFETTFIRR